MFSKISASHRSIISAAALIAAAVVGGPAFGQCNVWRPYIPDLDQRRGEGLFIPGLPCNGSTHCVPTSAADAIAYMANHGAPDLLNGAQHNWFSPASYNAQTALINQLGQLGGTTCEDGTNFTGMRNGLIEFCNDRMPGAMVISTKGYSEGNPCAPNDIYAAMLCNGFAIFARGTYEPEEPGSFIYHRTGGHILCARNIYDLCTDSPLLGARDPNSSDSLTVNSSPSVYSERMGEVTAVFRLSNNSTDVREYWEFTNDYGNRLKLFDGLLCMRPTFAMTGFVNFNQESAVNIIRPLNLTGPIRHTHVEPVVLPPNLGTIASLRLSPDLNTGFILTNPSDTRPGKLLLVNTGDNSVREAHDFEGRVVDSCTSTRGDLFVAEGRTMTCFSPTFRGGVVVAATAVLPFTPKACAFDDATQQLVLLFDTSSGPAIHRYNTDLTAVPGGQDPCPPNVVFDGQSFICIDPDGSVLCCSKNIPTIFRLDRVPGAGGLVISETIAIPGGSGPCNPHVNELGNIVMSTGGSVVELERNATGGWSPRAGNFYLGYQFGTNFSLATSRDGIAATIPTGPNQTNIDDEILPSRPDCRADFNDDGIVNSQDFFDFVAGFFSDNPYCDIDDNGRVNSQDFFDFLTAFFAGC